VYFGWLVMLTTTLWRITDRSTREFIIICLAASLPFFVFDIISVNHNMRLLTPALIPAMGIVSITLDLGALLQRKLVTISIALLFVIQAVTVTWPAMSNREDQWDWEQLRELAQANGFSNPSVVHLGNGDAFNPPQIEYPWICRGQWVSVERWLWRYEQGPIDWKKIDDQIDTADIVVTAPGFQPNASLDNVHNNELERRLRQQSDVWKTTDLYFGENDKVDVLVFLRQKSRPAQR
jgi:hypothetical protein